MMRILIFSFILLCCAACGRSQLEDMPWNTDPIPVVYSIVSPGVLTRVCLNKTHHSKFPYNTNPYPEAKVFICGEDSNWIQLPRISDSTSIFVDSLQLLPIQIGHTYWLRIELSDRTVHAQTQVPTTVGVLKEITCTTDGTEYDRWIHGSWHNGSEMDYLCVLNAKFEFTAQTDNGYFLSALSAYIYGSNSSSLTKTTFQDSFFYCPVDSTSFNLNLTVIDPLYSKYLLAQAINASQSYQEENMVDAIATSFGGTLPHFSNIVNGVGLFGSSVTVSKRVEVEVLP